MLKIFLILFATTFISFIGSLQLGPVNFLVIKETLLKSKKNSLFVAIGGCLPEFIYASIAVFFGNYITDNQYIKSLSNVINILIFGILGLYFFTLKFKKSVIDQYKNDQKSNSKALSLGKGFVAGIFNPQLIFFWILVFVNFENYQILKINSNYDKLAFVLGSGFGAFILLILIIFLTYKYKMLILEKLNFKLFFKYLGLVFIIYSLYLIVKY